ncbi:monocarboxylate transporter 13-like [Amphiura filiformis]|uniref:monocarboxylate transporter 13-like n=1 Tax=Amphiura filiformis TaxID=82378 RepID=UPI003B2168C7
MEWKVLLGGFVFYMYQLGTHKALGVFVPFFARELNLSEYDVGTACGIGLGVRTLLAPVWVLISDSFSPHAVTVSSGAIASLGFVLVGFADSWGFLSFGLLISGIGLGLPLISIPSMIRDQLSDGRHDTAISWVYIGSAVGMTLFPPIVERLIDIYGWRMTSMLMGVSCLNVSIGGMLFRQSKAETKTEQTHDKLAKCTQLQNLLKGLSHLTGFASLTHEPIIIVYFLSFCLWGLTYTGWTLFLISYAISIGFSPRNASLFSAIGGIGTLTGRSISSLFLMQQWPSPYLQYVLLSIGSGLVLACYPITQDYWMMMFLSFLAGIFIGTPPAACILITKDLTSNHPEFYSGALGLQHVLQGLGIFAGGPMTGYIYDLSGNFSIAFFSLACSALVAVLLSLINVPELRGCNREIGDGK